MKKAFYLLLFIPLLACDMQSTAEKISNLNGYWEITEVKTAAGLVKQYTLSPWVDYIEIHKDNKGFRKKVKPKFDGSYLINGDQKEKIHVQVKNERILLYYSTPMDTWKEHLIYASEDKIIFRNEHGNEYTYKRFKGYVDLGKDG